MIASLTQEWVTGHRVTTLDTLKVLYKGSHKLLYNSVTLSFLLTKKDLWLVSPTLLMP